MIGKAQRTWERLATKDVKLSYQTTVSSLCEQFEPSSNRDLYATKFQTPERNNGESWAGFADSLRTTADCAFPELDDKAKDRITLVRFLGSIDDPTVALSIRQRRPKTLNEASLHTLEIETILSLTPAAGANNLMTSPISFATANVNFTVHEIQETVLQAINTLVTRVEELEQQVSYGPLQQQQSKVTCQRCGEIGQRVCY